MSKEVVWTATIKDIIDTSRTFITTGNVLNESYSVGVLVALEEGISITVPLIKVNQIPDTKKIKEVKEKLKEIYDVIEGKTFTFNIPENKNINDKVETTGYKQGVSGNVDKTVLYTNRTLFNNRVRKALIKTSKLLSEEKLEEKITAYALRKLASEESKAFYSLAYPSQENNTEEL